MLVVIQNSYRIERSGARVLIGSRGVVPLSDMLGLEMW
jgi:hypothetical protein